MKFSCPKTALERAVGIAERFSGKNSALPILANILIEAQDNTLTVIATNLEHAAQLKVQARIGRGGKVSVPAKTFSSFLQSLDDENIEAEVEKGSLYLKTQTRHGRLNGTNSEEFPLVPKVKSTDQFITDGTSLAQGIGRVISSASTSEFKPEISGVLFSAGKDILTVCATDTFRLAECLIPLAKERSGPAMSFIMPHRSAAEFGRIAGEEEGPVSIGLGDNQFIAETKHGKIVSRIVEGAFPEYKAIIPSQFSTSAHIIREDILRGIRSSSIFASKLQEVTLRLGPKEMKISSANPEVGEYNTRIGAAVSGKEIAMSFNWRYFLDGIQALEEEDVFFGCNQESSPALLRNKSKNYFTYVVMPIRLT